MQNTRAQNALEFVAMLSVLLLIFIALFGFVTTQYGSVLDEKDSTTLIKLLEDIQNEIRQAVFAPDGYERSFYVQDRAIDKPYTLNIRNTGELYVNDSQGFQQILFLKPEEYLNGNICTRQNQIIKSSDYGVGICCNSCNGTVPNVLYNLSVECKTNSSVYWGACYNLTQGNNLTQLRVNCSLWMNSANITLYNQTGNQAIVTNLTSTNATVRNLSISWISITLPTGFKVKSAVTYNVSAVCYNSTSSYIQRGNFTIS